MKKIIYIVIAILISVPVFVSAQGCMEGSDDGGVAVKGYIQPQFDYHFLGDDAAGESLDQSSFKFNRARIGVVGDIPYDFSYYVFVETSAFKTGDPYLLDAFLTYKRFDPYLNVSMGSFKRPFGLELGTACHKLYTINRSKAVMELTAPDRDLGVMLFGSTGDLKLFGIEKADIIKYYFAVTNGTGLGVLDNNMGKNYTGRLLFSPFDFIAVGGSYQTGKSPSAVADAQDEDESNRFGVEAELTFKNFLKKDHELLLQGEYIQGEDIGSYTTGGGCGEPLEIHEGSKEREGWFAQAVYKTTFGLWPVYKLEFYDEDKDTGDNELYVQTFGISYFFNELTRLQVNYGYSAEKGNEIYNDFLQVQLQVVF